jgi:hypothetical protein
LATAIELPPVSLFDDDEAALDEAEDDDFFSNIARRLA